MDIINNILFYGNPHHNVGAYQGFENLDFTWKDSWEAATNHHCENWAFGLEQRECLPPMSDLANICK
jgi:hypothetical protein